MADSNAIFQYAAIFVLVCFSALFSGLTLGLLSLDKIGLKIVMSGEDPILAQYAETIAPVRENGNLLLCTLLLGNVAVNAYLSILTAELTSGLTGFLLSTVLIVIFGEIIPQASCSRYALQIGSRAIPIVKVLIFIMYPLTWPLSVVLDYVLGDELGTIHTRTELTELLRIHVQHGAMDVEQGQISEGAITYVDKKVSSVMSPFEDAYLLKASDILNFKKITEIFKSGYSRIPVYDKSDDDIIGILLVKDLIFVDPDDDTPVRNFIQIFGRNFHLLWPDDTLGDVLRLFKTGKSHMAIVRDVNNEGEGDPFYEMKGIVTLEDIIEEILQDEIHDETDNVNSDGTNPLDSGAEGFDYSKLRLLDSGKLEYEKLTEAEALAIGAHFSKNITAFDDLNYKDLNYYSSNSDSNTPGTPTAMRAGLPMIKDKEILVNGSDITSTSQSPASGTIELGALSSKVKSKNNDPNTTIPPQTPDLMELLLKSCPVIDQTRIAPMDERPNNHDYFYKKGIKSNYMIMVLTGKITVLAGKDDFLSNAGPWSVLGADALCMEPNSFKNKNKKEISGSSGSSGSGKLAPLTTPNKDIRDRDSDEGFVPDFSAYISSPDLRYIKITYNDYKKALNGEYVWHIPEEIQAIKGRVFKNNGPGKIVGIDKVIEINRKRTESYTMQQGELEPELYLGSSADAIDGNEIFTTTATTATCDASTGITPRASLDSHSSAKLISNTNNIINTAAAVAAATGGIIASTDTNDVNLIVNNTITSASTSTSTSMDMEQGRQSENENDSLLNSN